MNRGPANPAVRVVPAAKPYSGNRTLRLGTRRSELAKTQSGWVATQLYEAVGRCVELVEIVTPGDISIAPVAEIGTPGVFVSSVREALQHREVDFVVHSLKDLPVATPADLVLAAVPVREDSRDALVSRDGFPLMDLPAGSRIGTSSLRRVVELQRLGLPLRIVPLRGNVDSRVDRVIRGEIDAVIVAAAGLARLGRIDVVTEFLDPTVILPAPGQGALAIECQADDSSMRAMLAPLDHRPTRIAVTAERAFLATLELGCNAAVAAHATLRDLQVGCRVRLDAMAQLSDDAVATRVTGSADADRSAGLGRRLAREVLDQCARLDGQQR